MTVTKSTIVPPHDSDRNARRVGWKGGLLFYLGVQATSFGLGLIAKRAKGLSRPRPAESLVGNEANNDYYNSLRQPVFAPPDWVFAPVWTLNNALQIWGLLHMVNTPPGTPGRSTFLALQGAFWSTFVAFNPLYFGLRSPILGAATTHAGTALTIASASVALQMHDRKALASLSTVLPWLILAGATSTSIALWNRDDLFNQGPFTEPPPGWVKARSSVPALTTEAVPEHVEAIAPSGDSDR